MSFRSELAFVVAFPIPCSHCENENLEFVGKLVDLEEIACPSCGAVLDLNTAEWAAFRKKLKKLCVRNLAPLARRKASK